MKKRLSTLSIVLTLMLVVCVNGVYAGVYFSQPESTYNLGDIISINVDINPLENGPLEINLICNGTKALVSYSSTPTEENIFELPLSSAHISNLSGECFFSAEYKASTYESRLFKISKKLDVELAISSLFANPGEEIIVSGSASRLNGMAVNGEVEIRIPLLGLLEEETDKGKNESEEECEEECKDGEICVDGECEEEDEEEDEEETNKTELVDENGVFYGKVENGEFSVSFGLNSEMPAGDYRIDVIVYEESEGVRSSEGLAMANLQVFQVLTDVDLALNNQNLNPGEALSFKPLLIDQTGRPIHEEISVIIRDEESIRIFEQIVESDETIEYLIPSNLTAGYYEIESASGDVSVIKKFYVNEKEIVSFEFDNKTLVVTNIGNIPYNKDIQIELNGKPFVKRVDLELGESQEFKLTGADGEYDVKISDGDTEVTKSGVMLTGNVIGVNSLKKGGGIGLSSPVVWIFLIIVLGAGSLFFFRNVLKKTSFTRPFSDKFFKKNHKVVRLDKKGVLVPHEEIVKESKVEEKSQILEKPKSVLERKEIEEKPAEQKIDLVKPSMPATISDKKEPGRLLENKDKLTSQAAGKKEGPKVEKVEEGKNPAHSEAEQVLVLKGQRTKSAILVIRIKNKLTPLAKEGLENAVEVVYEKKGAVYEQGDNVIVIFSPLMTKTNKNEGLAAGCAEKIVQALAMHNKKFNEKIEFGIGINSGDIIDKVEDKKLKFTSLGNVIPAAKRLAEASDGQILVTKQAYESGIIDIKAEKTKVEGSDEIYEVKRVVDSEKNKKFIEGFLERQENDKKQ